MMVMEAPPMRTVPVCCPFPGASRRDQPRPAVAPREEQRLRHAGQARAQNCGRDEWVDEADYRRGIAVVAALIALWCGVEQAG
jgi:anti-sigma-K factor RskA